MTTARPLPAPGRLRLRSWCRTLRREEGSAAAEIAILTPLLVILVLFMVFLGRLTEARAVIADAAHQAARAASIARSPAAAQAQAQQAATTALAGRGLACQQFTVTVDLAGFRPGGTVRATITCTAAMSDLSLLRVPGSQTFTASFASVIDTYRGVTVTGAGTSPGGGGP